MKWVEWINTNTDVTIPLSIIADELGIVVSELGMLHQGMGTNTVRAVYLIDQQGIIRLIMYYPQSIGCFVDEVLRDLNAL